MLRPHRDHVGGAELRPGNLTPHTSSHVTRDTCLQVRQWQHWGSGCYNYACEDSRLHILILNHTYTCYHPGQELKVTSMGSNLYDHTVYNM